jgi:hypothetical protein
MDAIETRRRDMREGRISVDLIVAFQRQVQASQQQLQGTQQQLQAANQRIAQIEKKLGGAATAKLAEPFSVRSEEQRQEARGQNKRQRKRAGATRSVQDQGQVFVVLKDADTLAKILDPATFAGIMQSAGRTCCARPSRLLAIYREACRVQRDGRLGDAGRARKVRILDDQIFDLCAPLWFANLPPLEGWPMIIAG